MGRRLADSSAATAAGIAQLGAQLRQVRKALGLTVESAARAAGISRVTLHRIEKGEPNVSFGAVVAVADVLGVPLQLKVDQESLPPREIAVADYPGLRSLAWQLTPSAKLTPAEAWSTYSRNWRHLKQESLDKAEHLLIENLRKMFEGKARV